jgi:imidazoleglycerol-phosphate dehydratase
MLASGKRETKETRVDVSIETNGSGIIEVDTGIDLLDEILKAFGGGALFDLSLRARGDMQTGEHHTVEDTGLVLGSTLGIVIKRGIGSSTVPSGQTLAQAAVRFGEAGYREDFHLQAEALGGMSLENFGHFMRAFAYSGSFTLALCAEGGEDRSKIEAMSTALGRAIRRAARDGEIDSQQQNPKKI